MAAMVGIDAGPSRGGMITARAMEGREFVVVSHDGGGGDGVLGELRELRWWMQRWTLSPVPATPVSSVLPLSLIPSQSSFDPPDPQFHLAPRPTQALTPTVYHGGRQRCREELQVGLPRTLVTTIHQRPVYCSKQVFFHYLFFFFSI